MWKPSSVVVVCPPQRIERDKMEEVSSIELTVATFTDYRLECIESGIYQLVHASAEKFFAKPFLSLTIIIKKNHKKPHYFNRICRFGSNKSRRVNPPRQSFDGCKFSFKKKKKPSSMRVTFYHQTKESFIISLLRYGLRNQYT